MFFNHNKIYQEYLGRNVEGKVGLMEKKKERKMILKSNS